jgi:DNA-binding MarR family transcriptional regulator
MAATGFGESGRRRYDAKRHGGRQWAMEEAEVAGARTLSDRDYAALADFRYAIRRFMAFSEAQAGEVGLTPQQHQALLAIRAGPAGMATIGFVAERLVLKPHSATGLVDRLEALDLVTRSTSATDRRRAVLNLTAKAEAVLLRLTVAHRDEIKRLGPVLQQVLERFGSVTTD